MSLVNQYPYTNFHDVNLDYILKLVRENAGLHLEIVGNKLVMKTADNSIVSSVTISYAETADQANSATQANYAATAGVAATAQHASIADTATSATTASEAVHAASADTATTATSATNAATATYATSAGSATNATNAVNAQTAVYADSTGSTEHAAKAFEGVANNGDNLVFTLGDGSTVSIKVGVANKAMTDYGGNNIRTTYFASVIDDNGTLRFRDALGNVIASITPSSQTAEEDSYGNTIADYVKTITAPNDSNYITVQHGTGTAETLIINYSNAAWKDTNGNVIKNFYAGSMEIVEDADTGHYNLVVYNGDTPKAELYRFEILAYKAQEAEEADHAATADYATSAGTATTADSATTAATAANSCIFIQAYTNHDGSYSADDPDTVTIESITDAAGNSISMSDLNIDTLTNVILKFHQSVNDPILERYTVSKYWKSAPSAPLFLDFNNNICEYDTDTSTNVITAFHLGIGFLNGSLVSSECYIIQDSPLNPPAP